MEKGEKHTVNGKLLTRAEAARAYGWSRRTISRRMEKGMSLEEAVNVDKNPPPKTEKVCPRCHLDKPVAEYGLRKESGRRESYCKPCERILRSERAQRNREHDAARARDYRLKHKERLAARGSNYRLKNKESIAAQKRGYMLRWKYGINLEAYEEMLKQQGGVCLGCKGPCVSGKRLAVDHCHDSGKVRGLLCVVCNRAVGALKDNPATLRRLAEYLEGSDGRPSTTSAPCEVDTTPKTA